MSVAAVFSSVTAGYVSRPNAALSGFCHSSIEVPVIVRPLSMANGRVASTGRGLPVPGAPCNQPLDTYV